MVCLQTSRWEIEPFITQGSSQSSIKIPVPHTPIPQRIIQGTRPALTCMYNSDASQGNKQTNKQNPPNSYSLYGEDETSGPPTSWKIDRKRKVKKAFVLEYKRFFSRKRRKSTFTSSLCNLKKWLQKEKTLNPPREIDIF